MSSASCHNLDVQPEVSAAVYEHRTQHHVGQHYNAYRGRDAVCWILGEVVNHGDSQVWLEVRDVFSGHSCQLSLFLMAAPIP